MRHLGVCGTSGCVVPWGVCLLVSCAALGMHLEMGNYRSCVIAKTCMYVHDWTFNECVTRHATKPVTRLRLDKCLIIALDVQIFYWICN